MPDDKLVPAYPPPGARPPLPAERYDVGPAPAYGHDPYYSEPETEGIDFRRYLHALVRFKWLILLVLLIGAGVSYYVWNTTPVEYRAEGSMWIEGDGRFDPIQAEGILTNNAGIELLRSYGVLDSVVVRLRMHIDRPGEYRSQFASLELTRDFTPGGFELRVDSAGMDYVLATPEGEVVERGRLGEPIGRTLGWDWRPTPGAFPAGAVVPFQVRTPRDVSRSVGGRLDFSVDRDGNFLQVRYTDTNAERAAATVQALMERDVAVSQEVQNMRLLERLAILEEQLASADTELLRSEQELEEFRITTITLPSDGGVVGGLEQTNNPVFSTYFNMRVREEEIRLTRQRLQAFVASYEQPGELRIEALEMIPETANSSELRRIIDDLVDARSELRALSDRYSPEYRPIQELQEQIASIERSALGVVGGIVTALDDQERDLSGRLVQRSAELEAIPPRTIEQRRLQRSVDVTEGLYDDLRSRVESARLAAMSSVPEVRILDDAQVPTAPLGDDRLRLVLMIMVGCLGAAVGGAILLDHTDAKFRYAVDVSREMGVDILGSIPRLQGGRSKRDVLNAAQALESFRELRIHIGFAYGSAGPITLAVTSPAAGEGKSLISSNLAVAFAEVGRRTLLIDGDTRRGDAHRLFGLEQSPGLIDYLKGDAGIEIVQKSEHDNLDFIGCGSRGTSTPELLASSRMASFIGQLKQSYDVIIVDTPPLAAGGDALILGTLTGNLAVVIRTGSTEKHLTQARLRAVSRLPIRLLGAVLNDVDPSDGYHYYYSAYLPGYEPVAAGEEDGRRTALIGDGRG